MYKNLKKLRESTGMTQKEFASSLSVALTTYNGYETGARCPKTDFWIAVAQKYGVTIDYLMGFSDDPHKTSDNIKNFSPYSDEAMRLAYDYDKRLDHYGRRQVRSVADNEIARYDKLAHTAPLEPIYFITPAYISAMSAGTGQPAGNDYPENYRLIKEPPRGTSYIATVSGDSMEPTFHNEDRLFIRTCTEIPIGKVGVFYMDGRIWVKELGEGVLVSHNPSYDPIPIVEDIRCQGQVLGVCDESYFE